MDKELILTQEDFIKTILHTKTQNCKICNHSMYFHSSCEGNHCQLCRFENPDNLHSYTYPLGEIKP